MGDGGTKARRKKGGTDLHKSSWSQKQQFVCLCLLIDPPHIWTSACSSSADVAQQGVYFVTELSNLGQVVLSVKSFFVYKIGGETRDMITALSMLSAV